MESEGLPLCLGYFSVLSPAPTQTRDMLPYLDDGDSWRSKWPVLWVYPQYNEFDVVCGVDLDDLLVEQLIQMFPVKGLVDEALPEVYLLVVYSV